MTKKILIPCILFLLLFKPSFAQSPTIAVGAPLSVYLPYLQVTGEALALYGKTSPTFDYKDKIMEQFSQTTKMVDIIKCESNFMQFSSNGKPLMSPTHDVGIMQINQVHWQQAKDLGLDIFNSVDDNITMGKIVFHSQGIDAWTCHKMV